MPKRGPIKDEFTITAAGVKHRPTGYQLIADPAAPRGTISLLGTADGTSAGEYDMEKVVAMAKQLWMIASKRKTHKPR
jgi:hypothetical protein